jgi:hypothetical protein
MVLRVNETSIIRLINRFIPLDHVIPQASQDDFVYFTDLDNVGMPIRTSLCLTDQIPDDYIPGPGVYVRYQAEEDDRSYSILIEGSLTNEQLAEIPTRYTQAYSFLYAVSTLQSATLPSFPWRGGFSSMHFYHHNLPGLVPAEDRAKVQALQYASPGFIRFSVHRPTANALGKRLASYLDRASPEHRAVSKLLGYIAENKLNDLRYTNPDTTGPEWSRHNQELFSRTRELLNALEIADAERVIPILGSQFEAAKIVISFTRRLRELTVFVKDCLIRFPES